MALPLYTMIIKQYKIYIIKLYNIDIIKLKLNLELFMVLVKLFQSNHFRTQGSKSPNHMLW